MTKSVIRISEYHVTSECDITIKVTSVNLKLNSHLTCFHPNSNLSYHSSMSSSTNHQLLNSEWPVLGQAKPIPAPVLEQIYSDNTGSAIVSNELYLFRSLLH